MELAGLGISITGNPAREPNCDVRACIIRREERYWIVEKLGRAAEVSEKFDPRSRQPSER